MRKLLLILMVLPFTLNVRTENPPSMLEKAVSNIKRWEGWHRGKMPYIGYGHRYPNFNIITTFYCKYLKYNG